MRPNIAISLATLLIAAPVTAMADPDPAAQYSSSQFVSAILAGPMPCPAGQSQESCDASPRTRRWTLAPTTQVTATPRPGARAGYASAVLRTRGNAQFNADLAAAESCARVTAQDLCVTFRKNSDEITSQGQANLRAAALGLKSDSLATLTFEVAGYTDSSGSAAHNLTLSGRRADSVKAYLVGQGVAERRLKTEGYGSAHLADPANPTSPQNRRVELHRLN
jgi:outer membrane protein OmpA-like peptidoglycan-associated protein